jgi:hypothetical protein
MSRTICRGERAAQVKSDGKSSDSNKKEQCKDLKKTGHFNIQSKACSKKSSGRGKEENYGKDSEKGPAKEDGKKRRRDRQTLQVQALRVYLLNRHG